MTATQASLTVGSKVTVNGGYAGTVIEVCRWADDRMVVVRLARGEVCVSVADVLKG